MTEHEILSVSAFNRLIQNTFSRYLPGEFRITGQITGWTRASSGHIYFSVKDETDETVRCIIWRSVWSSLAGTFSGRQLNGLQVICTGSISFYGRTGSVNLVISRMEDSGIGLLWARFLQIRSKLEAEGLFSPERKRPLPEQPRKIALVTSPAGEVLRDVCKVAAHRNPSIPIVLVPVPVQGAEAVPAIVQGLETASRLPGVDVVILARGGGSMEDLWCFNDERVARAIAACPLPVVTGIGHEPDTTIADFAADRRASTPSNAAEIVVPDLMQIRQRISLARKRLEAVAERMLHHAERSVLTLRSRMIRRSPEGYLDDLLRRQDQLKNLLAHHINETMNQLQFRLLDDASRLDRGMDLCFTAIEKRLAGAGMALKLQTPEKTVSHYLQSLELIRVRIKTSADHQLVQQEHVIKSIKERLVSVNPEKVLERGYAFVTSGDRIVSSGREAPDNMTLHFHDGNVQVRKMKEEESHGR